MAAESKHTPGPWSGAVQHWPNPGPGIVVAEGGRLIASVPHKVEGDGGDANAILIVAAPDLLAALESAPTIPVDDPEDFYCTYQDWYEGPRAAALAKVKS